MFDEPAFLPLWQVPALLFPVSMIPLSMRIQFRVIVCVVFAAACALTIRSIARTAPALPRLEFAAGEMTGERDMRLVAVLAPPPPVFSGDTIGFAAIVQNLSPSSTETTYTVAWRIDGVLQFPAIGGPLDPGSYDTLQLPWITTIGLHGIIAVVESPNDTNAINDTARTTILVQPSNDLATVGIVTPDPIQTGTPSPIGVIVENVGNAVAASYTVGWMLDGASQTSTARGSLEPGVRDTIPFVWGNPSLGAHTLSGYVFWDEDQHRGNDTAAAVVTVYPAGVVLQEGFEGVDFPPAGWSTYITAGDTNGWTRTVSDPITGFGSAFDAFETALTIGSKWLATKRLRLDSSLSYEIVFRMKRVYTQAFPPDTTYIRISTTDSLPASFGQTVGRTYTGPISDTLNDPNIYGTTPRIHRFILPSGLVRVFIAWDHRSNFGQSIYVDDVVVRPAPQHDIGAVGLFAPGSLGPSETLLNPLRRARQLSAEKDHLSIVPITTNDRITRSIPSIASSLQPSSTEATAVLEVLVDAATTATLGVVVQNFGNQTEPDYQVGWSVNGIVQTPFANTNPLIVGTRDTLQFSWTPPGAGLYTVRAWTILAADPNRSNDSTFASFEVPPSDQPLYQSFNGSQFPPPGWTAYNVDGGALPPWFRGGSPTALFPPYHGAGFAGNNYESANGFSIDDYLVSSQVAGRPETSVDTLIFFARGIVGQWDDSLMIMVSTTGNQPADFTTEVDYIRVPQGAWTRLKFALAPYVPASMPYWIAFRYLHYDGGPGGSSSNYFGIDSVVVRRDQTVGIIESPALPTVYSIEQNYPNPFNPITQIRCGLPVESHITLKVYNALGQEVVTLADEHHAAGYVTAVWNGRNASGREVSSGLYFYHFEARSVDGETLFAQVRKMVLVR
jgi:hypothetical protein